jgi:hypothetical protein
VILAPAFALSKVTFATILSQLGGPHSVTVIESDAYSPEHFKQHHLPSGAPTLLNLILLTSLKGLQTPAEIAAIKTHTEKIYYFSVNFTHEHLEGMLAHTTSQGEEGFAAMAEAMQSASGVGSLEQLAQYVEDEVKNIEGGGLVNLKKKASRNLEEVNGPLFEKGLLELVEWAQIRLQPVTATVAKSVPAAAAATNVPQSRRISTVDPNPVLKKNTGGAQERSHSASKRVQINDVPEFAPAKTTPKKAD